MSTSLQKFWGTPQTNIINYQSLENPCQCSNFKHFSYRSGQLSKSKHWASPVRRKFQSVVDPVHLKLFSRKQNFIIKPQISLPNIIFSVEKNFKLNFFPLDLNWVSETQNGKKNIPFQQTFQQLFQKLKLHSLTRIVSRPEISTIPPPRGATVLSSSNYPAFSPEYQDTIWNHQNVIELEFFRLPQNETRYWNCSFRHQNFIWFCVPHSFRSGKYVGNINRRVLQEQFVNAGRFLVKMTIQGPT